MGSMLPYELTKDWGAVERLKAVRDLLSISDSATRRSEVLRFYISTALDAALDGLSCAKQEETQDECYARIERELDRDYTDHPTLSETFGWGERYAVINYRLTARGPRPYVANRGYVIGHERILTDSGGPESGPGPLVEEDAVVLKCDDGNTIKAVAADCQPDEFADENVALWGTP
jgi:hypothetical protein